MAKELENWLQTEGKSVAKTLLSWYDTRKRDLPWRQTKNPYYIWLSEIMLQQTQAKTVVRYYNHFITRWPTLTQLAEASETEVLKAWEGLGYYSRARNILKTAHIIQTQHHGLFPQTYDALLSLPGIGEYTAGAVMSIAFNQPYPAVDGNVVRVGARLTMSAWHNQRSADKKQAKEMIGQIMSSTRCGDFNEALMDLGATVCLPDQPLCNICPLHDLCLSFASNSTADYPVRIKKEKVREEKRVVLLLTRNNKVYVEKKQGSGLLAGLYQFIWLDQNQNEEAGLIKKLQAIYAPAEIIALGQHQHIFTHLKWQLKGFVIDQPRLSVPSADQGYWVNPQQLRDLPVSNALNIYRQRWLALIDNKRTPE